MIKIRLGALALLLACVMLAGMVLALYLIH